MGSRKCEPTDQKPDRIIGGLGYGIQEWDILGPNRLDVVHKSGEKKHEKEEEKREREKNVSKNEAGETEQDPIQKKGDFFDLTFHKRPIALGRMVNIEGGIGYFVYDVIGCGDGPSEEKDHQGFSDKRQRRSGRDLRTIQKNECPHTGKDGQTSRPPFQPHCFKIRGHFVYLLKRKFRRNLVGLILSEFF
jgi:hypothetical protein